MNSKGRPLTAHENSRPDRLLDGAVESILDQLPESFNGFESTEYSMPVSLAILGEPTDMARLRAWLAASAQGELKDACEPVAIAAEVIESMAPDRDEYFLDDDQVRRYVFRGAKWKSGWVLLAGAGISDAFIERLIAEEYMVFSDRSSEIRDQVTMPSRETSAIYFLQMMVRYAMIWGQIPPGDDHAMAHFLEQDMPGALVVRGQIGPIEGLVLLALMKLGCPAVVDADFPYDIGSRALATNDDEVMDALGNFPNMRVRVVDGTRFSLPDTADPANLQERIEPARVARGFFQLRAGDGASGVIVTKDEITDRVAIIVKVTDEKLDLPVSAHLEAEAIRMGSYLPGIRAHRDDDGAFLIEIAQDVVLDGPLLGEVILAGLKHKYPRIGPIQVRIGFGARAVARERTIAEDSDRQRDKAILAESEETVEEFHLCIDCQPFSHSHVCVITPDRPPMCGRRRNEIKAGALWGADYRPWTRRDIEGEPLQHVIAKGVAIDEISGEWPSINAAVKELTDGQVERVRIHAVGKAPHTSCGCFSALAFRIPGIDGIGVMHRRYEGLAPGQLTWSKLANRAGGKQSPGVTGVSLKYLKSPRAFGGEGGLSAVKWATKKAYEAIKPHLPPDARVATEEDAKTLTELKEFLGLA